MEWEEGKIEIGGVQEVGVAWVGVGWGDIPNGPGLTIDVLVLLCHFPSS